MSSCDGLKHATVDKSAVGKLACQWERDCQGRLIARWRRGCLIGSRTRLGGADSCHARRGAHGKPTNSSRSQAGDVVAVSVQPPVSARRARRLIATAVITALYLWVGLVLILASAGTESL
jgi:hypothetical protein